MRVWFLGKKGTAGVAIAGLLGAVRAQGLTMLDFPKQKIVVAGAGRYGIFLICILIENFHCYKASSFLLLLIGGSLYCMMCTKFFSATKFLVNFKS